MVRLDNVLYVTTPQNAARLQAQQNQRPKKLEIQQPVEHRRKRASTGE